MVVASQFELDFLYRPRGLGPSGADAAVHDTAHDQGGTFTIT